MRNFHLPLLIGLRYTRSSNRQRFLSLLSWVSLLGMVLGVAALIIVLSVMNGFQAELRDRMLSLIAHGHVERVDGEPLPNWQQIQAKMLDYTGIVAVAPWVGGDVMLSSGKVLRAVELQGVDLEQEKKIARIQDHIIAGDLGRFASERFPVILGRSLANSLGLGIGERVTVVLPQMNMTPLGPRPRVKQFTIVAIFEVGAEMDATHAYIPVAAAQRMYALDSRVHALRYLTTDVLSATGIVEGLQAYLQSTDRSLHVLPWTLKRQQLFSAIKMEKIMVTFMLSMVIAVAAFNLISVLSMMVSEKRGEIAVLRMMGISQRSVLMIFLAQGLSLSLTGLVLGLGIGVLVAMNLSALISFVENLFGFYIFDPSVYYISGLPSLLLWQDVMYVFLLSIVLSMVFAAYPAYRASKIRAVEALQYQ